MADEFDTRNNRNEDRIETHTVANEARTMSSITLLAGIWLIIAPFVLNFQSPADKWQEITFGIIVGVLGIVRLAAVEVAWPSWINTFIGLWLIIAPWVIPNSSASARWNQVIVGIIIAVFAYNSGSVTVNQQHTHQTPRA